MPKPPDPLEEAINAEKAAALGASARKLRRTLDALRAFDENATAHAHVARETLVEDAAEACWGYIVQRELIGLGFEDAEYIRRQYRVPDDVWRRLGPKLAR